MNFLSVAKTLKLKDMKTGIELIAAERAEQIEKHGYTTELDKNNTSHQLSEAARILSKFSINEEFDHRPTGWDRNIWERMCVKPHKDRLIIAGALIAAEIDRLQS
jgi:hypothetical protein